MNLGNVVGPVLAQVASLFGPTRIRVRVVTGFARQPDGSSAREWGDAPGLTSVPAIVTDIADTAAVRAWATEHPVTAQMTIAVPSGVVLAAEKAGVAIVAGPRAGQRFLVVGIRPSDVTGTAVLALTAAHDTLGLP